VDFAHLVHAGGLVSRLRSVLREPLLHFLVLGGLLFLIFQLRGGASGPGGTRIAITPGLVEHLASGFARTWQRPPTDQELKGLIDDHIKEEIATREATAMGLDRDDAIIRRRLRQKLEFLVEDAVDQAPPTDAELQAWLDAHPGAFRREAPVPVGHRQQLHRRALQQGAVAPQAVVNAEVAGVPGPGGLGGRLQTAP